MTRKPTTRNREIIRRFLHGEDTSLIARRFEIDLPAVIGVIRAAFDWPWRVISPLLGTGPR